MAAGDSSRVCRHCGITFTRERKGLPTMYCTIECRRTAKTSKDRARNAGKPKPKREMPACTVASCTTAQLAKGLCPKHYFRQREHGDVHHTRKVVKHCEMCGAEMPPLPAGVAARRRTCSRHCGHTLRAIREGKGAGTESRRARNVRACAVRKARIAATGGERIKLIQILERDEWRCQICRRQLDPADRGTTKPEAPEVDHVVPLAQGGAHRGDNLQCACRRCNLLKGARRAGRTFGLAA